MRSLHRIILASSIGAVMPYGHTIAQILAEPFWAAGCLASEDHYAEQLADSNYFLLQDLEVVINDIAETPCNPGDHITFGDSIPYYHPLSGIFLQYVHRRPNIRTIQREITVNNLSTGLSATIEQHIVAYDLLPHSTDPLAQPFVYLEYGTIDYQAIYDALQTHQGELFDFTNGCGVEYNIDVLNVDGLPAIIDVYPWGNGSRAELYWRCSWGQEVAWYIQHVYINDEPFIPCPPPSLDTLDLNPCIYDNTAPIFENITALGFSCSDIPPVELPLVFDDFDAAPVVTHIGDEGGFQCISNIIRTFQATDGCGNTSYAAQEIYINNMSDVWFQDVPTSEQIPADAVLISPYDLVVLSNCYPGQVIWANMTYEENSVEVFAMAMASFCANSSTNVTYTYTATSPEFFNTLEAYSVVPLPSPLPQPVDLSPLNANNIFFNFTVEEDTLFTQFRSGGDNCVVYTVTRTYRTFNAEGTALTDHTFTQVFEVTDPNPPFLEVGDDMIVDDPDLVPPPSFNASDDHGVESVVVDEEVVSEICPISYTLVRTYTATDSCGNSVQSIQTIIVDGDCSTVGVQDKEVPGRFGLHPNPSEGSFWITFPKGRARMELFNATGELVLEKQLQTSPALLQLDPVFAPGTYLIRLTTEHFARTERLLLMR